MASKIYTIRPFSNNQIWENLRVQYNRDRLFEDTEFPSSYESLFIKKHASRNIKWKRPWEIIKNPEFIVNGIERCDMTQGSIGNCWFIAACIGLMQSQDCFNIVVPNDQDFGQNYSGMFHFRFWLYDQWVDVVIDDRLPYYSNNGSLVFSSNKIEINEFWGSLLEKAFAKFYGSYEALDAGIITDALMDLTGGITEQIKLEKLSGEYYCNFWTILYQSFKKNTIIGCGITGDTNKREERLENGLVAGHAFVITNVFEFVDSNGRIIRLIRIKNPWGDSFEWNRAWSDYSYEWSYVGEEIKRHIEWVKAPDGEFWMSYEDFMKNMDHVLMCHLTVESFSSEILDNFNNRSFWKSIMYEGEWNFQRGTAGGCGNLNPDKYYKNPQFLINLSEVDTNEVHATVIVSLIQKNTRKKRMDKYGDIEEHAIQFRFYRYIDNNNIELVDNSGNYTNQREVTKRFKVLPGYYLIIPSMFYEDKDGEFLLRIFTENKVESNSFIHSSLNNGNNSTYFWSLNNEPVAETNYNNYTIGFYDEIMDSKKQCISM